MKRTRLQALLVGLAVLCAASAARASWFQVEVVIFAYTNPDSHGEIWYQNPGLPDQQNSIELITDAADPLATTAPEQGSAGPLRIPYRELPAARYRLEGVERVLKLSREYRPLLHVAWQQQGEGMDNARAVHLELPRPISSKDGTSDGAGVTAAPEDILDGIIRLRVSRFVHVDVDMAYFPDNPSILAPPAAPSPGGTPDAIPSNGQHADYVRLTQSRKVKLNELDYFDHPLFGLLVQVSRLQVEQQPK